MLTREELLELAGSAGFKRRHNSPSEWWMLEDAIERFAVIIIANFLERTGQYVTNDASRQAVIAEAVAAEREACAKVCEGMKSDAWADKAITRGHNAAASNCAAAIRARGAK